MRRIQLSCTISIFLSTAFCARAVEPSEWEMEAVRCERVVWEGADVDEVNAALLRKAALCREAGCYADAIDALNRVRRYSLGEEGIAQLLSELFICHYQAGAFSEAAAVAVEMGALDSVPPVRQLNPDTATLLSLIPGAGLMYARQPAQGALALGEGALSIAWAVSCCSAGAWGAGLLGASMALYYTLGGSSDRAYTKAVEYNEKKRSESLEALLKPVYDSIISAR